ncbi:MAG: hypothetical protein KAH00_01340 [Cocleimonas sp.]|nr:hypothetical protein [Cocleimonas sp.]
MGQTLLFILSGVFIGLAIGLLVFRLATKKQLKQTKMTAMANMYNETLLKRKNNKYCYTDDAERVVRTVNASHILES